MPRPVKWILWALVGVGFIRGVIHFNDANDTNVLGRLCRRRRRRRRGLHLPVDRCRRRMGQRDAREWVNNAVPSFFRALTGGS